MYTHSDVTNAVNLTPWTSKSYTFNTLRVGINTSRNKISYSSNIYYLAPGSRYRIRAVLNAFTLYSTTTATAVIIATNSGGALGFPSNSFSVFGGCIGNYQNTNSTFGTNSNEGVAVVDCTSANSNTPIHIIGNNMLSVMAGRNIGNVGNTSDKLPMSYVEI